MSPTTNRHSRGLAVLTAALALLAAGCGGSTMQSVANTTTVTKTTTTEASSPKDQTATTRSRAATATGRPAAKSPGGPTKLVDEWATCERNHGDTKQANPTIDAHGVINITTPGPGSPRHGAPGPESPQARGAPRHAAVVGAPHDATGTCSDYLTRAQAELRATHPVRDPHGIDNATYLKYVACMRANGIPNYPSPEPNNPKRTDFIGSGVNPNSPHVLKVHKLCGKKLQLPTWWIKGWGPPGDITVRIAGLPVNPPACAFTKKGCGAKDLAFRPPVSELPTGRFQPF